MNASQSEEADEVVVKTLESQKAKTLDAARKSVRTSVFCRPRRSPAYPVKTRDTALMALAAARRLLPLEAERPRTTV